MIEKEKLEALIEEIKSAVIRESIQNISYYVNQLVRDELSSLVREEARKAASPYIKKMVGDHKFRIKDEEVGLEGLVKHIMNRHESIRGYDGSPRFTNMIENHIRNEAERIVREMTQEELKKVSVLLKDKISELMLEKIASKL